MNSTLSGILTCSTGNEQGTYLCTNTQFWRGIGMSASTQAAGMPKGPGFITVILDIPFSLAIPNGAYTVIDPVKGIAVVQTTTQEGSRTFFRDVPITGPTSFTDLKRKAREYERPRQPHSYIVASRLTDGTQKATLNIHSWADGGFAECL